MFNKVLIANRGEIAVRVIRACRELGLQSVAIYPDHDQNSYHVQLADEAVPLDDPKGYLNVDQIIKVANDSGAGAIHPGYGFLSENPSFARQCRENDLVFVGPHSFTIEKMGTKTRARTTMKNASVPVVPGTTRALKDADDARNVADEIGYPVVVKAAGGGGGKGLRVVEAEEELESSFSKVQSQGERLFGMPEVYLEKLLDQPRHVEIQIFADNQGNVVHMGERDCSLQRRRQKVLEEGPSPRLEPDLRDRMGDAAVKAARAVDYVGAGTVEFLLDREDQFYFLEMNTRIQVEHPVTEMLTGIDLVKQQLRVALDHPLPYRQQDIRLEGAAIECRINAENPYNKFKPSPGTIEEFESPQGPWTRLDSFLYTGYEVKSFYDPLIGKLIVWGQDRSEAIERMKRALRETVIKGIHTTLPLHRDLLEDPSFQNGVYHVDYLEDWVDRASNEPGD